MNFSSPGANKIRIVAVVCVVVAVLQLAFATVAAGVLSEDVVGSWWCGIAVLITVIFTGMKATNLCSVVSAIIGGVICIVLAIVAAVIDGILSSHFNSLDGCMSSSYEYYGDASAASDTSSCFSYNQGYSCVCTDRWSCWGYDLESGHNCGELLDELPSNLGLSALFAVICAIVVTVFSCFACGTACCPNSCGHYDPNHENENAQGGAGQVPQKTEFAVIGEQQPVMVGQQQPVMVGQQQPVMVGLSWSRSRN